MVIVCIFLNGIAVFSVEIKKLLKKHQRMDYPTNSDESSEKLQSKRQKQWIMLDLEQSNLYMIARTTPSILWKWTRGFKSNILLLKWLPAKTLLSGNLT